MLTDCPAAVSSSIRTHIDLSLGGHCSRSQMTLALWEALFCSEGLALVLWVRPLMPLLKEELKAKGCSGNSQGFHWRHFF